jgi:predicted SnoaL-like aldol condensation-catalyzing enzyme
MRFTTAALALSLASLPIGAVHAQEAVVGVADADALFKDKDPKLNRNKQAAYHIVKDLLEANQWDKAGTWLTDKYIQHNPLAASGLKGVIYYFTQVAKRVPSPVPEKMKTKIVSVVAEGDYVVVVYPREMTPKDKPAYSTTWFDMWRFVDGKADEHWDPAMKP